MAGDTLSLCVAAAILAKRAELAGRLADLEAQAVPIRADIFRLDAAIAPMGGRDAPRMRARHRPEWFADLRRLVLDVLCGAPEPMTSRTIAVELMRLVGHDVTDRAAVEIVNRRARAGPPFRARACHRRG
jgi:hypothetical protein